MSLAPGTRIGPYEIVSMVGAGGMGEVYRARDQHLNRDIALKILPEVFALEPDRVARFKREAQVLASLNHPHIAAIYGFAEADGIQALALELVEGPTLADRIARGPIPIDEALPIARQIAEAVEAAHERGIIHRDLKPANIKLHADGTVKVLDFGLAKVAPENPSSSSTDSPTITTPAMTELGVVLGTAAYMAPEQAKDRPADKRGDLWAFGCVLYEMLSGKRAFQGDDVSDTLALVLRGEPQWDALPASVPHALRTLIGRCLVKDRNQRVRDVAAIEYVLTDPNVLTIRSADPALVQGQVEDAVMAAVRIERHTARRRFAIATGAAIVLIAGAAIAYWLAARPRPARATWLHLAPSPPPSSEHGSVLITPDGARVVYVGADGGTVYVRLLDQLEATPLPKLGRPRQLFASPDAQWLGFIDLNSGLMKKVSITGGPPIDVTRPAGMPLGASGTIVNASWGVNDTIVFATSGGLFQVGAGGGEAVALTRPDPARGEASHDFPSFLPDGNAVLFTIQSNTGLVDAARVAWLDLQTREYTVLLQNASDARHVSSGHLIYTAGGATMMAVAFDARRRSIVGSAVPVLRDVSTTLNGRMTAGVATDGTLVYATGQGTGTARAVGRLLWVDRQGKESATELPPDNYGHVRVTRAGTHVAVTANQDIWMFEIARPTLARLTSHPSLDGFPVWQPDGKKLYFSSSREGARKLFVQSTTTSEAAQRLLDSANRHDATSMSPDGIHLLFTEYTDTPTRDDILQLAVDGSAKVTPLVRTQYSERNGEVSPDGRWLAYQGDDTGRFEIYVCSYPDVRRWRSPPLSAAGGTRPLWGPDSRELFYLSADGALMGMRVIPGPTWTATPPAQILDPKYLAGNEQFTGRTYDISRDGRRFLMIKPDVDAIPGSLVVVQRFDEVLRLRVGR